MKLHLEILDQPRKECFLKLAAFKKFGYLAGGTALALQLKHRLSCDFDIFCPRLLTKELLLKVKKVFTIKEVLLNSEDELTFIASSGVKISFIYYPFGLNHYRLKNRLYLDILNTRGVALTKAYVLNRRNSWRDYLDLYFIIQRGKISLKAIIKEARAVYQSMFNAKLFLGQLLYTKDIVQAEIGQTKFLKEKVGLKQVKDFFRRQIDRYLNSMK